MSNHFSAANLTFLGDDARLDFTALVAERWEDRHTLCRSSHATGGTIDVNPIGEREMKLRSYRNL
jgi:hypothetical protein